MPISKHREKIQELAHHFDSSFFLYDLDGLTKHLSQLQNQSSPCLKLWYACKANPLSSILRVVQQTGIGIDVASQGELEQAFSVGFKPQQTLSTGPSKSRKYLRSLLKYKVRVIVCESHNQLIWLNQLAKEENLRPEVLIRVQLSWQEGTSVLGGNEITPFGIDIEGWENFDFSAIKNLDIIGYHVFQWGNILDCKRLTKIWSQIAESLIDLNRELQLPLNVLDLGGGLGIPYSETDDPIQFKEVSDAIESLSKKFAIPEIWMELGRYAVGEFGYYCTQIIDRKIVRGRNLLVTDGGINHIARPALTGQAFPAQSLRQSMARKTEFHIHGPLCTALDKLGVFSLPKDLQPGDWLIFTQAGAYGMTEAMPYFLCHNLPAEVILKDNSLHIVRAIQTSAKWLL